jgi:hypothetical protein
MNRAAERHGDDQFRHVLVDTQERDGDGVAVLVLLDGGVLGQVEVCVPGRVFGPK